MAGTINICPSKRIKGRQWRQYDHAYQEHFLMLFLLKLASKFPYKLDFYEFETCPHLQVRHVHFAFTMSKDESVSFVEYVEKQIGLPSRYKYKTIVIKGIYNATGWNDYMIKDQYKNSASS